MVTHKFVLKAVIGKALAHWTDLKAGEGLPVKSKLDPLEIPRLLNHTCLIEVIDGGRDFRYLIIGDFIRDISHRGQSKQKVSEIESQGISGRIFEIFSAAVQAKRPQFTNLDYVGPHIGIEDVDLGVFPLASTGDPHQVSHLWSVADANFKKRKTA